MKLRGLFLTVFTLSALLAFRGPAVSADESVVLQGILQAGTFFGPPNYGEYPAKDTLEESYYLQLPNSLDEQLRYQDKYEIADKEKDRDGGCFILLAGSYDVTNQLKDKVGKKLKATGTIFESYSPRHRTPILLQLQKAEAVEKYTW
jgi:hypothetical protein